MVRDLKRVVINLKSLDQQLEDPFYAGNGDVYSRTLKVILTQEAKSQLSPYTKLYLKWHHEELNTFGYNVLTPVESQTGDYNVWEIYWPKAMLYEGHVRCTIELVDNVGIGQTRPFLVYVMPEAHDGSTFIKTDDYTAFQEATIMLATLYDQVAADYADWQLQFASWEDTFDDWTDQMSDWADEFEQWENEFAEWRELIEHVPPIKVENAEHNQVLMYDGPTQKWKNKFYIPDDSIILLCKPEEEEG